MKKVFKRNTISFTLLMVSLIFIGGLVGYKNLQKTQKVQAKEDQNNQEATCQGDSGNLYGYITTDNVGPIYVDSASYESATGSSVGDFYVNYDKQDKIWSGKGWNDNVGWVDFSYDQMNHLARFVDPGEESDTGCAENGTCDKWGGWNGQADLSGIQYLAQNGVLVGDAEEYQNNTGGESSEAEDDYIGSGVWHFDHVGFKDPACPEEVHLFINEKRSWYSPKCPADLNNAVMQWTSQNVHDCKSTKTAGFWDLKDRDAENTSQNVTVNGTITEDNSPVIFEIECIGDLTGSTVNSYVTASCGTHVPPNGGGDGNGGTNPEDNIISPNIIEA